MTPPSKLYNRVVVFYSMLRGVPRFIICSQDFKWNPELIRLRSYIALVYSRYVGRYIGSACEIN